MKAWLTALLVSAMSAWILAALAPRLRLVDQPDARKQHEGAVPLVGGLAILLGFVLSARMAGIAGNFAAVAVPVGLAVLVGLLDDIYDVPARHKLWAQIAAVWLLLKTSGLSFETFALPGLGSIELGVFATPFSVVLGVGLLNAINTIDGVDGLCGGLLVIGLFLLAAMADAAGMGNLQRIILLLQAAVTGFLMLNARLPWQGRARVFLGDAGAFGVGMLMLWFMLQLGGGPAPKVHWSALLAACWMPMADLLAVAALRLRCGQSPFAADRRHFHHLLLAQGRSPGMVVLFAWGLAIFVAVAMYVLWRSGARNGALFMAWATACVVFALHHHRAWRERGVVGKRDKEGV